MKARIPVFLVALLSSGCSSNPLLSSPEGKAVDANLRDTLPDGKYEVVRWWPAKPVADEPLMLKIWEDTAKITKDIARDTEEDAAANEAWKKANRWEDELKMLQTSIPLTFCRLKFRFVTEGGGKGLREQTFLVANGKVTPIGERMTSAVKDLFPE